MHPTEHAAFLCALFRQPLSRDQDALLGCAYVSDLVRVFEKYPRKCRVTIVTKHHKAGSGVFFTVCNYYKYIV